jgi:hypothetical protein
MKPGDRAALTKAQHKALARIAAAGPQGNVWLPAGYTDGIQWRTMQALCDVGLIEHIGDSRYAVTTKATERLRERDTGAD